MEGPIVKYQNILSYVERQIKSLETSIAHDQKIGDMISKNGHEIALGELRAVREYIIMAEENRR